MYSLFTAAALFYLDIPHKNSIELCLVGCSLAAFEDEIFAGVFSGQRPTSPTVHIKQHQSSEQYLQYEVDFRCPSQGFQHQSAIFFFFFFELISRFYVIRRTVYVPTLVLD